MKFLFNCISVLFDNKELALDLGSARVGLISPTIKKMFLIKFFNHELILIMTPK